MVVGYQTKATVVGFNFLAPTFKPVGGDNVSVQDIKLDPATATSWADNIQILDEGGATVATYTYATAEESGLDADGWVDESGTELVAVTVPKGASVLVSTEAETTVTFSGEVDTTPTEKTSVAGFNFVGNNTPVAINIQSIKLDPETAVSWADNLQILDEGGATIATYTFATAEESGLEADGWVDESGTELVNISIDPGQGVLVATENDGVTITIPAAL